MKASLLIISTECAFQPLNISQDLVHPPTPLFQFKSERRSTKKEGNSLLLLFGNTKIESYFQLR